MDAERWIIRAEFFDHGEVEQHAQAAEQIPLR
jgi:hypothetical protein